MKLETRRIRRGKRCVECGDRATGFLETKPYCTYCYNKKRYFLKVQQEKEKRDRKNIQKLNAKAGGE